VIGLSGADLVRAGGPGDWGNSGPWSATCALLLNGEVWCWGGFYNLNYGSTPV